MDIKLTKTGDDADTLKIDSICIENISMGELSTLSQLIDTDVFYREDVNNYIEDNGLEINEETFEEILEKYAELRSDNNGAECGMSWTECLAEAFESIVDDDDSD